MWYLQTYICLIVHFCRIIYANGSYFVEKVCVSIQAARDIRYFYAQTKLTRGARSMTPILNCSIMDQHTARARNYLANQAHTVRWPSCAKICCDCVVRYLKDTKQYAANALETSSFHHHNIMIISKKAQAHFAVEQ